MKLEIYLGVSLALATLDICIALFESANFYSFCVALTTDSTSILILANLCLILTYAFGKLVQYTFFGPLRILEIEHLHERGWFSITETFLAITIYREGFTDVFLFGFALLTFLRIFHWIFADRVDLLFQTTRGPPSLWSLVRVSIGLSVFFLVDLILAYSTARRVLASGPNSYIVFAFEYSLLLNNIMVSAGKLILNILESNYLEANEEEDKWESKSIYSFYMLVFFDSTRLIAIIAFFFALLKPYGIPLHLIRDAYVTFYRLITRIRNHRAFLKTRAAMDNQIPNAVESDLERDDICIICREEMSVIPGPIARKTPKRLNCGHVIHNGCLKSWFERSQQCPTCRRPVLGDTHDGPPQRQSGRADHPNDRHQQDQANQHNVQSEQFSQTDNNQHNIDTNNRDSNMRSASTSALHVDPVPSLPVGWGAVRARTTQDGQVQIELNPDIWATVAGARVNDIGGSGRQNMPNFSRQNFGTDNSNEAPSVPLSSNSGSSSPNFGTSNMSAASSQSLAELAAIVRHTSQLKSNLQSQREQLRDDQDELSSYIRRAEEQENPDFENLELLRRTYELQKQNIDMIDDFLRQTSESQ